MNKPLIISDCDEVLLHMVAPFKEWLETSQGVNFNLNRHDFAAALSWQDSGKPLEHADVWRLLGGFFDTEMHRQNPISGAVEAVNTLQQSADFVVLTNLTDERQAARTAQLENLGIHARVFTNQGPKGPALAQILAEYNPSVAIFIDDLPQHHHSASEVTPDTTRLHFCGEPLIASHINCAFENGHAHARIDNWDAALPWLQAAVMQNLS